ncbi:MAG TPA: DUF1801 domain-containing protein [Flavipsychrobacter sp.]|nr:DUF1801 domain-containing protein [Flavipsychrobacter sp.]
MQSKAATVAEYIETLPEEKKEAMIKLRDIIVQHLPEGFEERMSYGMITYVVPHSIYPNGYHCDPKQALPFLSIAAQKNFIAVYHMGIYSDPNLLEWFQKAYAEQCGNKLDMGKSCIRFKKPEQIPFGLMGELAAKMTPQEWITLYEGLLKK